MIPPQQTVSAGVVEVEQDRSQSSTPVTELSNRILDASFEEKGSAAPALAGTKAAGGGTSGPEVVLLNGSRPSHKRRSSESETRDTKRQYSLERRDESADRARERERQRDREGRLGGGRSKTPSASASLSFSAGAKMMAGPIVLDPSEADDGEAVSPETNLRCLVNFFRWVAVLLRLCALCGLYFSCCCCFLPVYGGLTACARVTRAGFHLLNRPLVKAVRSLFRGLQKVGSG